MQKDTSKLARFLHQLRYLGRKKFRYEPGFHSYVSRANRVATTIQSGEVADPDNPIYQYFAKNDRKNVHKWHHYFEIYHRFFAAFRNRSDLRILEIGVFRGGSLDLWRNYFHEGALIVGLDRDPSCQGFSDPARNIFVEIGDQCDQVFLQQIVAKHGPFDIIIDDGGHKTSQQIASFNILYPDALCATGIYFVEDVHTNFWRSFRDTPESFVDIAASLVDRLNEPYFEHQNELYFRKSDPKQISSLQISKFGAETHAISFFDSVVVFEKRRRYLPVSELR